jgi:hypothetical protein
MTTKHFHNFNEFEEFASKQPLGTQYHVFKVAPDGIGVKIYEAQQGQADQEWTAASFDKAAQCCAVLSVTEFGSNTGIIHAKSPAEVFADLALGDPSMKCVVTGVTEYGTTGTVVPIFP